ncbi:MAG TPA: hypothetical protein VF576_11945, partial [Rubricoccaceae bacterium]
MLRFRTHLAVALSLLALSACDTGEPDAGTGEPSDLVGSWTLQETTSETFLTVTQAQSFVDRGGVQTGSVSLSGAVNATLRYIAFAPSDQSSGDAVLTSFDPSGPGTPVVRHELRLSTTGQARLFVSQPNGSYTEYYAYSSGPTPLFTYVDGRLTVRPITLQDAYGGSGTVSVAAGSVSFPTVQLPANQRTRIRMTTVPFNDAPFGGLDAVRYVLEDGGVYRAERDYFPNVTRSTEGTWEADGDRLRLTARSEAEEGGTETQTVRYSVDAGRLQLDVTS